jgi:transposase
MPRQNALPPTLAPRLISREAACETAVQAQAPERPIAGGLATPALLSQVLVSKYCDYTPFFRQSQIFARHGLDLPR